MLQLKCGPINSFRQSMHSLFPRLCGFQRRSNELLMSPLHRYVSAQSQVAHNSITAASSNNSAQTNVLMRENERLRKELEVYVEKAARLQKVREEGGAMSGAAGSRRVWKS